MHAPPIEQLIEYCAGGSHAYSVNSDPLSQHKNFGVPRFCRIAFKVETTSSPFNLCPTSIARLSHVNTSMIVKARNRRPSANWSATKSKLHTSLGRRYIEHK